MLHYLASLAARAQHIGQQMSRDKADTLLLMVACALVLAPHAAHLPLWATLTCVAILAWRGWITVKGQQLPPRWILLPISMLAMAAVYGTYKTFFGRDAGVMMLVLLLAFKMLEMHAKRDLFVVVLLSFFLMLTNFFYSQTIGTAFMMGAAVIAMLTVQLSFQYTGSVPPLKQRLRLGALIFSLAIPLMLVLFVLFPRIQGPLWGLPSDANSGRTGLSDSMTPGNISNLVLSDEIAFTVKFIDPAPPQSRLYWRGVVLGNYDGRTWSALVPSINLNHPVNVRLLSVPIRHQVTLEPNGRRWLFALDTPQNPPRLNGNPSIIRTDLQLLASGPINQRVRYDVASSIDFEVEKSGSIMMLQDWLELPPGFNPRTHAFAAQLRNQAGTNADNNADSNMALVNKVLTFFRTDKFSYTLEPPLLGKDAVDDFLFVSRAGFCEHYSSAFVILMRALNIPARVVTGYQGGDVNPVDGIMTIRQSDAHAWAEVWLENRGWVRVDPTAAVAPERISLNLTSVIPRLTFGGLVNMDFGKNSWLTQLIFRLSAGSNAWNQWVLNYTPDKQKNFLRALGFDDVGWRTLVTLMVGLGAATMALIALPLLMQGQKIDPVDALYSSLCRRLAHCGIPRDMHEGPQAYGARLSSLRLASLPPHKQAAVMRFLKLYQEIKYGRSEQARQTGRAASAALITELKSLLSDCR